MNLVPFSLRNPVLRVPVFGKRNQVLYFFALSLAQSPRFSRFASCSAAW